MAPQQGVHQALHRTPQRALWPSHPARCSALCRLPIISTLLCVPVPAPSPPFNPAAPLQFFTVTDPDFQEVVNGWEAAGAVRRWDGPVGRLDAASGSFSPLPAAPPRYVATGGMRALAQHLETQLGGGAKGGQPQGQGAKAGLVEFRRPCWVGKMQVSSVGTAGGIAVDPGVRWPWVCGVLAATFNLITAWSRMAPRLLPYCSAWTAVRCTPCLCPAVPSSPLLSPGPAG